MKRITLVASEMVDGKKVELGRDENFPECESLDDIITLQESIDGNPAEMTEPQIVGAFNGGNKVRRQASLRSASDPKSPTSIFKKLSVEKQNEMLRKMGLL